MILDKKRGCLKRTQMTQMTRIYADMGFLMCLIINDIASVKISVIRVIRVQKYLLRQPLFFIQNHYREFYYFCVLISIINKVILII